MHKVDKNTTLGGGIVRVVCGCRARVFYDEDITLDDCRRCMEDDDGETDGTVLVIFERGLSGKIYRYGNHGKFWEKIGKTVGFA